MKRIGNLYEKVISMDNLRLADAKARKGKKHSYGVRRHDRNREANLLKLHEALKNKTFHTSKYYHFMVYEPKERRISRLPYYPDRIVHHAIMNVLEPIWTKIYPYNTYSCIKHRGVHACRNRVRQIIRQFRGNRLYCLKIDIRKFYPSIDHEVMKAIIRRKIKDKDLLWLLDGIIDSTEGLPIGNYISQSLSNLYLTYFMHWVNETLRVTATVYADDIVFYSANKALLHNIFRQVQEYMSVILLLHLKGDYQIFPIALNRYEGTGRALDYVGYQFFIYQTLMRKSIKQRFCRRSLILQQRQPRLEPKRFKRDVSGWLGWAKYSDSKHLLQTIFNKDYYDFIFNEQAKRA